MSDPNLSDIDFKNKMVWVSTTLKKDDNLLRFRAGEKPLDIAFMGNRENIPQNP